MERECIKRRIWDTHSAGYEEIYLLGSNSVLPAESQR
jgi:hypothetical protein